MSEVLWWNYGIMVYLHTKEILYTFRSHETGELEWRGVFTGIENDYLSLFGDGYIILKTTALEQIAFLKSQNVKIPKPFLLLVNAYATQ